MANRIYEILHTTKPQVYCREIMDYPLSYINHEYCDYQLDDIIRPIMVETEAERAAAGDFPKNIQEFFWVRGGENDGDSWLAAGQLTNGAYFFYSGGCDYTGFDCQGGMNLWVSKSWKNIIDHAMDERDYEAYLRLDTPEPEGEDAEDSEHTQAEEEEERYTYPLCSHCQADEGGMPNEFTDEGERLCADCYWDLDAEEKHKRRIDPEWRFHRIYSSCVSILNMTEEEAKKKAYEEVEKMEGGKEWLARKAVPVK